MAGRVSINTVNDGLVFLLDGKNPTSGPLTRDIAGSNEGSLENGVTLIDDVWEFDGVNDYINFGDINNTDGSSPFSYGCWFKANAITGFDMLMGKYEWNSGHGWYIFSDGSNKLTYLIGPSGGSIFIRKTTNQTFNTGTWYYTFVTYNGSKDESGFKMYINGLEAPSVVNSNNYTTGTVENNFDLVIGCSSEASDGFFNGQISSAKIYNRELSASEVLQNFNATKKRYGL